MPNKVKERTSFRGVEYSSLKRLDDKLKKSGFVPRNIATYDESPVRFLQEDYMKTGIGKVLNIIHSRVDFERIDGLPIEFYVLYVKKG